MCRASSSRVARSIAACRTRTVSIAAIAWRSPSRFRARETASTAWSSIIARASRSFRGCCPIPECSSTSPTRRATPASSIWRATRFRSRTTRPSPAMRSSGTRASDSRHASPTTTARSAPCRRMWAPSPAWKGTRSRSITSTRPSPTRSASTPSCSSTAATSPTSTSGTTSCGMTSRRTRPSPSAYTSSASAGNGERCVLGSAEATRIPGLTTIRVLAALAALAGTSLACAEGTFAPTRVESEAGSATAIGHWQIQTSAKAQQSGAEVSAAGFSTKGWYPVSGRATVMAGLLENGTYENVFYGDNLRAVAEPDANGELFVIPWWYRTEFTVAEGAPGIRTLLRINGIISSADVWLNGQRVAEQAAVAGAYPVHELDVTPWVHAGINTLALRAHPGDPRTSLSIGWDDWNPTPPDNNMGPWRGVDIVRTGPVEIRFPQVTSALPDLMHATLSVKLEARNLDASPHDTLIDGVVAGVSVRQTV